MAVGSLSRVGRGVGTLSSARCTVVGRGACGVSRGLGDKCCLGATLARYRGEVYGKWCTITGKGVLGGCVCGATCRVLLIVAPLVASPCLSQALRKASINTFGCTRSVMACFVLFNALKDSLCTRERITCFRGSMGGHSGMF